MAEKAQKDAADRSARYGGSTQPTQWVAFATDAQSYRFFVPFCCTYAKSLNLETKKEWIFFNSLNKSVAKEMKNVHEEMVWVLYVCMLIQSRCC
jgi:hypothetical protein